MLIFGKCRIPSVCHYSNISSLADEKQNVQKDAINYSILSSAQPKARSHYSDNDVASHFGTVRGLQPNTFSD